MDGIKRTGKAAAPVWRALALAAAVVLAFAHDAGAQQKLEKVPFAVSWFAYQTHHMPYWLAKEKGWYAAEGLDVEINQNRGSEASIQALTAGQLEFAEVSAPTLLQMLAKGKGQIKVRMVGMTEQKLTHGLGFLVSSGIKTPKDFEGKTLGIVAQSMNNTLWPTFARTTGIDASKVRVVNVDWTSFRPMMMSGRTDIANWELGMAEDVDEVLKGQPPVSGFTFGDYLPLLGSGFATTSDLIEKRPELVRAFARATQKALAYMIANPREAVTEAAAIQTKYLDKIPSEKARIEAALEVVPTSMVKDDTKGKPAGWSNPEDWQKMIETLAEVEKWPSKPTVKDAMTNAFVE